MKYFDLNPKLYNGFRYQIPFTEPVHWSILNWCMEDSENRQVKLPLFISEAYSGYVELKKEDDLAFCLLRWE